MKHLKLFKTAQDKETWKNSDNYITPNVIYVNESDAIEFNPNHSNISSLSLQTFTAYPEVKNAIMNIANKYFSDYVNGADDVNGANMSIFVDMNVNYEGINYGPGCAFIHLIYSDNINVVECNLSIEDLNYLQSISIVDTAGIVYKPHVIDITSSSNEIRFNIYEDNTNDQSNIIRQFYIKLDENGYIKDTAYPDPNAPEMPEPV